MIQIDIHDKVSSLNPLTIIYLVVVGELGKEDPLENKR